MERWSAESIEAAKEKIDEQGKKPMTEVIQAATEKSSEIETLAEQTRNLVPEEERKNAE